MDLERVMVYQAEFLKDDQESLDKFQNVLKKFRERKIHSSTAALSVYKFLDHCRYSDVLLALKPFLPASYFDFKDCLRFLTRLADKHSGEDGLYTKFLDFMSAYSRKELTFSEVCTKVVDLLGKYQKPLVEFNSLLPTLIWRRQDEDTHEPPTLKRRRQDRDTHEPPTQKPSKEQRKLDRNKEVDFKKEDQLCDNEVKINQLKSTYEEAKKLQLALTSGSLSSQDVRADQHFSALNLCCIRKRYNQILVNDEMIRCEKLDELMQHLMKKKGELETTEAKLNKQWIKIRQSRNREKINLSRGRT